MRDSSLYDIVRIGEQTWMAENLNYDDSVATPSLLGRSWCYNDDPDSCAKYGRLYTWAAAMDSANTGCGDGVNCDAIGNAQGICPAGWHLPDSAEWAKLLSAAASDGGALKSATGWRPGVTGTNSTGFSGLPGGEWRDNYQEHFFSAGERSYLWSSSIVDGDDYYFWAYTMDLYYGDRSAYVSESPRSYGKSVRCVKD